MPTPYWFLGFDSFMEIVDSIIAFTVGYYAFKGYRLVRERTLLFLHFSFITLGAGLLVHGTTTAYAIRASGQPGLALLLTSFGYTIFFFTEVVAYGLLVYAYLQQTKELTASATSAFPLLILRDYSPFSEIIIFFLLAYITSQCAINYAVKKQKNALLVLTSFFLITLSHLLFLFGTFTGLFFVFAHVMQLTGFTFLLMMLLRVSRVK